MRARYADGQRGRQVGRFQTAEEKQQLFHMFGFCICIVTASFSLLFGTGERKLSRLTKQISRVSVRHLGEPGAQGKWGRTGEEDGFVYVEYFEINFVSDQTGNTYDEVGAVAHTGRTQARIPSVRDPTVLCEALEINKKKSNGVEGLVQSCRRKILRAFQWWCQVVVPQQSHDDHVIRWILHVVLVLTTQLSSFLPPYLH